jgi:VIT1/CCC1 family predicted Fe2+/Mn2+ transporter
MFCVGAAIPLMPFLVLTGGAATVASAAITGLALLVVGTLTARLTGRPKWLSALRQFGIGMGAALVTYLVGRSLGVNVTG